MAKRIDTYVPRPTGRPRVYPWAKWADGSAWRIVRGTDFEIPAPNMAAVIRAYGHRNGLRASAKVEGDSIDFQFVVRADEPERAVA